MSYWYEVKDGDNVSYAPSDDTVDILFDYDPQVKGNIYVTVPAEIVIRALGDRRK